MENDLSFLTLGMTRSEAQEKKVCVGCSRCAERGCPSTSAWTDEEWTNWDMTSWCPTCSRASINAALDLNDRKNDARNWADTTLMEEF